MDEIDRWTHLKKTKKMPAFRIQHTRIILTATIHLGKHGEHITENHLSDGCDPAAECWDRLEQAGLVRTGKYPAEFCIQHALHGASHNVCKFYHRSKERHIFLMCAAAIEWNG